jgi:hypothetical protein
MIPNIDPNAALRVWQRNFWVHSVRWAYAVWSSPVVLDRFRYGVI